MTEKIKQIWNGHAWIGQAVSDEKPDLEKKPDPEPEPEHKKDSHKDHHSTHKGKK